MITAAIQRRGKERSMFQKATRKKQKARIALIGTSGSGKTYTALKMAKELAHGGGIAVLDTEHGSASKYSGDVADFDVAELVTYSPQNYIDHIEGAADAGYPVLIIDSLSHAYSGKDGLLAQVDKRGGQFSAWKDVTPMQHALVDAILSYPGHVIVTMRAKTEYVVEQNSKGKSAPRKVGLAPVQRDGMEYEFDITGMMDDQNNLTITKTRCSRLANQVFSMPGAEIAQIIEAWLDDGVDAAEAAVTALVAVYEAATDEGSFRDAQARLVQSNKVTRFSEEQKATIKAARAAAQERIRPPAQDEAAAKETAKEVA